MAVVLIFINTLLIEVILGTSYYCMLFGALRYAILFPDIHNIHGACTYSNRCLFLVRLATLTDMSSANGVGVQASLFLVITCCAKFLLGTLLV